MSRQHAAPDTLTTLTFDGPHTMPQGGQYIRAVVLDEHGCQIDAFMIDSGDPAYGPHDEHPDRAEFGWPEGIDLPFSFSNGTDVSWAVPDCDAAILAACHELAVRLDEEWWDANGTECLFAV
jgi:hypothetical protein